MTEHKKKHHKGQEVIEEGMMNAGLTEKIQPQPYPLQGQSLPTGWGQYPQGAYYPPPVQKPVQLEKAEQHIETTHILTEVDCVYCRMPPNLPKLQARHDCQICQGIGYQYTQNEWLECQECKREFGGALMFSSGSMPEVYKTLPTHFPKVDTNPQCSQCYGTGYKFQNKVKDWRVCEYCAREHNTDLTIFQDTNLVSDSTLYSSNVSNAAMIPPLTLPVIKSAPDCVICHGQGYEWKQNYWAPCERCIKKFGNFMVCKQCVGTGTKLKDGTKCKCLKHHLHPAKV
ncbi:UNKNOWN [Stylonychia lemnae]|uniref:Uncharacterized protein n=1 Tax=Stylonychia lemnae TaxID=5949 RepID=A0A078A6Y5_STYLE|nr:UNKNOWN [Stylonychia lemnae]|eukprot:CDW77322.1 UNKNOWN [Stylonychia lemnae]